MAGATQPAGGVRVWTPAFVLLGLTDLAYFTGVGISILALPVYVTGPIGSDEGGAGLAFGAFAVTALLCRPYAGRYSDRLGRRPVLLVGALLCGLGMALMPHVGTLAMVVLLRLLQGVGEAAFYVAAYAMLADLAPPARMGEALSYNSLGLYLGFAFGPPIGEVLLERGGIEVAWYGAAVLAGIAAVMALALPDVRAEEVEGGDGGHGLLFHRPALPLSIGFFCSLLAVSACLPFAALHSHDLGMSDTSLALFVYGCVIIGCRLLFARLPDRMPPLPLATVSLVVTAVGLVVMAGWGTPTGLLVGTVVMAAGVTFTSPALFAAIFATARPSERGAAVGTASLFIDLGLGFGPMALGLVARAQGIPWAFSAGAGLAVLGGLWTARLWVRARQSSLGTSTQSAM